MHFPVFLHAVCVDWVGNVSAFNHQAQWEVNVPELVEIGCGGGPCTQTTT